jgi:hypothetical protein
MGFEYDHDLEWWMAARGSIVITDELVRDIAGGESGHQGSEED